jgi:hypothetical protein
VQAKSVNSTFFSPDVQGRVDATRTFNGRELNTEYVYGLFVSHYTNPGVPNLFGYPISYEMAQFAASQNIASSSVIVQFNLTDFGIVVPVWIGSWVTYNADKQISQYDTTFRWLDYLMGTLISITMTKMNGTETQATAYLFDALSSGVCKTAQTYCNGTNQQYDNFDTCKSFLAKNIRFGSAYELGMNTLGCRVIHEAMVPYRPEVHCPHIGPSGGGMCVDDYTYVSKVTEKYFSNAPFMPSVTKNHKSGD